MIILIFSFIDKRYHIIYDWDKEKSACHPDYYFGTVGDFNVTRSNFDASLNSKQPILLFISSSNCKECCYQEPVLKQYIDEVFNDPSNNFGVSLKVGRLDLVKNAWFMNEYKLNTVPEYYLLYQGKAYLIPNKTNGYFIMKYINKTINPIELIDEERKLIEFIKGTSVTDEHYVPKRYLIINAEPKIIDKLYNWSFNVRWRQDMKVAKIDAIEMLLNALNNAQLQSKVLKSLRQYDLSVSSILSIYQPDNFSNEIYVDNLPLPNLENFTKWYFETSYPPVEELSKKNIDSIFSLKKMVVQAFIANNNKIAIANIKSTFTTLSREFGYYFSFTYLNYNENKRIALHYGIYDCTDICISVNYNETDSVKDYTLDGSLKFYRLDSGINLNKDHMRNFLLKIIDGMIPQTYNELSVTPLSKHKTFQSHFKLYKFIDKHFYINAILKNDKDYIIINVNSLIDMDIDYLKDNIALVKDFLRKAPEEPIIVFNDIGISDVFDYQNKNLLTSYIVVNEIKYSKNPIVNYEYAFKASDAIVDYLKLKRFKLPKNIEFSEKERENGITYDFIFEGKR